MPAALLAISGQDSPLSYRDGFFDFEVDFRLSCCFQETPNLCGSNE
jgi:hypothetical protein